MLGRRSPRERVVNNKVIAALRRLQKCSRVFDVNLAIRGKVEILLREPHHRWIDLNDVDLDSLAP